MPVLFQRFLSDRFLLLFLVLLLSACSPFSSEPDVTPAPPAQLTTLGYAIQVGAFSQLDNAVRLERLLQNSGLDAYYFKHESGLYKVRFGNHGDYAAARSEAERFQAQGLIDSFFIVSPQEYAASKIQRSDPDALRSSLVSTAKRFIGVPYRWGGEDRQNGFDCSGLTMVSYRLNGLDLPRNSRAQYAAGEKISKSSLRQGDLVFFATSGGSRVTHVGLYVGGGQFIHAPRTGKTVRIADLDNSFFRRTYVGARTYL